MKYSFVRLRSSIRFRVLVTLFIILSGLKAQDTTQVLFLGSSYFNYPNLPELFIDLASDAEHPVRVDQRIPSGLYLADHASSAATQDLIESRDWDFVILQGVGSVTAYPDYYDHHPVLPALRTLQDKISTNCASTETIFCMPWAYEDGMTWLGWSDTYADMQEHIYSNSLSWAEIAGLVISPVGWSWYTVLEDLGYPLHYLHRPDWNHPSLKGSYLMACTIFSTVFVESCVGNSAYAGLPDSIATYFQDVASATVLEDLETWNIEATSLNDGGNSHPETCDLFKVYPNPFNPTTTIRYDLPSQSHAMLKICDITGRTITTLEDEWQSTGIHTVQWNGTNQRCEPVDAGVYFCRLQVESDSQTIKMLYLK